MSAPRKPDRSAQASSGEIPAGDSPPRPRWPLYAFAVAWGLWILFMVAMLIIRLQESPRS